MDYKEVLANAKKNIGPNCKVCPICNGLGCGHTMPGPGSKAPGNGANENYKAWHNIKLNMDTLVANTEIDTSVEMFGKKLAFPLITAPIGSIRLQYNPTDDVRDFNEKCMAACETRQLMHAYSAGLETSVLERGLESSKNHDFRGFPVFNPDKDGEIKAGMDLCRGEVTPPAITVVVDSAGLPHMKKFHGDAGAKSVEQMKMLHDYAQTPFVVKGIMTVKGALKAVEAGADAIVVSNHGGRVLAETPATAEVLPEIAAAVKGKVKIIVDGGIRSGLDIFKAIALGADCCMICRPVLISYYGGGQEGIESYFDKLLDEFNDTMYMCGARSVSEITRDMIRY